MNLVIKQTRVVEVPVTTLHVCQDIMTMTTLLDADGVACGQSIFPTWIPQVLEIDLATGQIKNWCVPTGEQLQHIADAYADGQSAAVAPTKLQAAVALVESPDFFKNRFGGRHTPDPVEVEPIRADEPPEAEQPYTILDLMRDNSPDVYEAEMRRRAEKSTLDEPTQGIVDSHFAEVEKGIVMFGGAVPDSEPVTTAQQLDLVRVWYDAPAGKWTAQIEDILPSTHQATSTQGKFEAIKNVLKKANLHGVYEINRIEDELYSYDGSRTLNADTVYMTQGADGSWSARMPNNRPVSAVIGIDGALTGLLKEMEGIQPEDAVIIETTDDEMRSRNKRRYAVTSRHEYVNTPEAMFNALQMVSLGFNLPQCDGLACIAAGFVKLAAGKSTKDIDGQTMSVLQLTEKGNELWSILGRSSIDQDSAAEALKAYLLKDPNFDQLSLAVESCKTSVGLRCLEMHIESIEDQQMQGALWDAINRRKPYMLDTTAA